MLGRSIYYLPIKNYENVEEYQQAIEDELVINDYYVEKNVFWVLKIARWNTLLDAEKLTMKSKDILGHVYEYAKVKHSDAAEQKRQISVYRQESNPTT